MMISAMDSTGLKKCDIVMKGGITSGIVYATLVCNLAERYQFESIGGTSAGAIAASLTAAAEYARRNGRDVFKEVANVPAWLGASSAPGRGSNLFHLFQPQPGMEGLFRFATAFLIEGWLRRILIWCRVLWLEMLIGVVPGVALAYLGSNTPGWRLAAAIGLGLLVALAGSVVAAILGVLLRVARLPGREYGLCTGYADPREGNPMSLTAWLNERLNTLAGMPPGHPLTFGDLLGADITLKMITTCLTFGCPFTLPFESTELYYSSSDLRRFFRRGGGLDGSAPRGVLPAQRAGRCGRTQTAPRSRPSASNLRHTLELEFSRVVLCGPTLCRGLDAEAQNCRRTRTSGARSGRCAWTG